MELLNFKLVKTQKKIKIKGVTSNWKVVITWKGVITYNKLFGSTHIIQQMEIC